MYHTRISYRTRIRIWYNRTRMVWLFVPYAYSCTILLLCASNIYVAITNTALLFVLDHVHSTAICSDALRGLMHSDKLIISRLPNNTHLACCESHWNHCYTQLTIILLCKCLYVIYCPSVIQKFYLHGRSCMHAWI